jgi:hypothetical protein
MIDRNARDKMEEAIRSYMGERLTAFELDEALSQISDKTDDKTVQHVGRALWFHYDDITDHKIVASHEEWDYFNRLALLLKSEAELDGSTTRRRWSWENGIAAIAFVGFICAAIHFGWGEHLFIVAIPFGAFSMLLGYWANRTTKRISRIEMALTPFPSIASLLAVRRTVTNFSKNEYPSKLRSRRIRSPVAGKIMLLPAKLMWLVFAPIPILFQMCPQTETTTRIKMPEPPAGGDGKPAPQP